MSTLEGPDLSYISVFFFVAYEQVFLCRLKARKFLSWNYSVQKKIGSSIAEVASNCFFKRGYKLVGMRSLLSPQKVVFGCSGTVAGVEVRRNEVPLWFPKSLRKPILLDAATSCDSSSHPGSGRAYLRPWLTGFGTLW